MKSLILNGSPRGENGVHGSMIKSLGEGLAEAGSEVAIRNVYELDVRPCQSCFSCWRHTPGSCVQKDDMVTVLPLVAEADILVLATPVYVDGMTGPMKTLLDRLIPILKGRVELRGGHTRHLVREHVKRGTIMLLSSSGFSEMDNFDPLVAHVKAASLNLGRRYAGAVLVPSGWYLKTHSGDWSRVQDMIHRCGVSLASDGDVPEELSSEISALVPRDKVNSRLNIGYGKYE